GQDQHKKKLQRMLIALGVVLFGLAIGGGIYVKKSMDETAALAARTRQLEEDKAQAEQQQSKLRTELENTKDPEKIAQLQQQLDEQQRKVQNLNQQMKTARPAGAGGGGGAAPRPGGGGGGGGKPCNCTPGDPLCSCL